MTFKIRDRIVDFRRVRAADLVANPKNWRRHPEPQRSAIRASLREIGWAGVVTGFNHPDHPGKIMLIDGHLRAESDNDQDAEVPIVILDVTPDEADKLLATFDPIAALADCDLVSLSSLAKTINFQAPELRAVVLGVLEGAQAEPVSEDDPPEAQDGPCVAQVGDVWACGRHRVVCGDATDEATVAALLGDARPFIMVTDPPYGVNYDPTWRRGIRGTFADVKQDGLVSNDERADWSEAWLLSPATVAYVWHGALQASTVAATLVDAKYQIRSQIIWRKQMAPMTRGHYRWQHEPCWYAARGSSKWCGDINSSTIWDIKNLSSVGGGGRGEGDEKVGHGTQKPVECMARPIRNHGDKQDDVYDPFLGSGTTLIAAEQLGRTCYGIEIEPRYVDVILRRYMNFTDVSPVRESDRVRFADLVTAEAVPA